MNSKIIKFGAGPNSEDIEKPVKNLGWLLRNWKKVSYIFIQRVSGKNFECELMASIKDIDGIYFTEFNSYQVCLNIIDRPIFRGLPIWITEENGAQSAMIIIGSPKYRVLIK